MDITLVWVEESGDNGSVWNLRNTMYCLQLFDQRKTAKNIEQSIAEMLAHAGLDPSKVRDKCEQNCRVHSTCQSDQT